MVLLIFICCMPDQLERQEDEESNNSSEKGEKQGHKLTEFSVESMFKMPFHVHIASLRTSLCIKIKG